ncbi:MAG: PKD domain-containing protein [Dehalococcoidia bacterium]
MKIPHIVTVLTGITLASLFVVSTGTGCNLQPKAEQPNRPPVIDQIIGPKAWLPQTESPLTCVASDPDGDNLTYTWTADNGTIKGSGSTITWMSPARDGLYNITLTVSDGRGGTATMVQPERVIFNADGSISQDAPVVLKITLPSSDVVADVVTAAKRVRIWTASSVIAMVDGAETKSLKYLWTSSNGRIQAKGLNEGTASQVNWIAPGAAGDYTLDVVVNDNKGNSAKGTVNFKVFCCGN